MTTKTRAAAGFLPAALTMLLAGCAGATMGSGVGDARLERAPYYAGRLQAPANVVAYLPVGYQAGASHAAIFDPEGGEGSAVAELLAAMNASLAASGAGALSGPLDPPAGTPPDVHFGCDPDATDECILREEATEPGDRNPGMRLAVGRPNRSWAEDAAAALDASGADALLVLTLEVGQYWTRQTNWRGSKEVELGTDHAVSLPWLTSLDAPVSVLQLTGALVGPDGKAIRIGAEGLLARRTGIVQSGFGLQALITDEEVADLLTARREDLPGRPLVWETALRTLVEGLTKVR